MTPIRVLDLVALRVLPALFGHGLRRFDHLEAAQAEEPLHVVAGPHAARLKDRVLR